MCAVYDLWLIINCFSSHFIMAHGGGEQKTGSVFRTPSADCEQFFIPGYVNMCRRTAVGRPEENRRQIQTAAGAGAAAVGWGGGAGGGRASILMISHAFCTVCIPRRNLWDGKVTLVGRTDKCSGAAQGRASECPGQSGHGNAAQMW